jgi:hypothetical protein
MSIYINLTDCQIRQGIVWRRTSSVIGRHNVFIESGAGWIACFASVPSSACHMTCCL